MKTKVMFFMMTIMFVAFFGSQMVRAESYQRWISFGQPGHIMTASEMADIVGALGRSEISPQATYRLSTGVTYKIPQPDLFLEYIVMCVKEGEPSIITMDDVVREIQGGDVVRWGNDINVRVKNFYFSSLHNRIQFIDNYSGEGADGGVFVLLIKGRPKIKMDCGNPLWVIGGDIIQTPPQVEPNPTPLKKTPQNDEECNKKKIITQTVNITVTELGKPSEVKEKKVIRIRVGNLVIKVAVLYLAYEGIKALFFHKKSTPIIVAPIVEPRTMPPGIPATPVPTTPGLPSDPRTMPSGGD